MTREGNSDMLYNVGGGRSERLFDEGEGMSEMLYEEEGEGLKS